MHACLHMNKLLCTCYIHMNTRQYLCALYVCVWRFPFDLCRSQCCKYLIIWAWTFFRVGSAFSFGNVHLRLRCVNSVEKPKCVYTVYTYARMQDIHACMPVCVTLHALCATRRQALVSTHQAITEVLHFKLLFHKHLPVENYFFPWPEATVLFEALHFIVTPEHVSVQSY